MHVETIGSGEPILLIHGWGMHGGMWQQVADALARTHTVHRVDLPGHGLSKGYVQQATAGDALLEDWYAAIAAQFSEPMTVCGWSLGGQIALRWALRKPDQVKRLILVATTPCFVQRDAWLTAMAPGTLQEFAQSLLQNHALTLKRFLALQVRGSENEKEILSGLREQLFAKGEPHLDALKAGLEILRDVDMRHVLPQIAVPMLVIGGERDTLTPAGASEYMAQKISNAELALIKGAAHAPFLSHQSEFIEIVKKFLNERI